MSTVTSDHLGHVADTVRPESHTAGERRAWLRPTLVMILRIALCFVFGLPLIFMIVSSFKPDTQIFGDLDSWAAFLPVGSLSMDNYTGVFGRVPFATFMINSVFISISTVVLGLLVNSMAAFALSRIEFRGQKVVIGIVLATLIVPFETMALPLLWWVNTIPYFDGSQGWLDTYAVQIIPFLANAFGIFLMRQAFLDFPDSLVEAARIDGAGELRTFYRVVMPVALPQLAALVIYTFMSQWNAFIWPLLMLNTETSYTVPLALNRMIGLTRVDYSGLMLGSLLATLPLLLVFLFFQKQFIAGLLGGAVKG